ncbi:MAG: hypothetical protein ABII72_03615 [Parcubacteria group bacterium]
MSEIPTNPETRASVEELLDDELWTNTNFGWDFGKSQAERREKSPKRREALQAVLRNDGLPLTTRIGVLKRYCETETVERRSLQEKNYPDEHAEAVAALLDRSITELYVPAIERMADWEDREDDLPWDLVSLYMVRDRLAKNLQAKEGEMSFKRQVGRGGRSVGSSARVELEKLDREQTAEGMRRVESITQQAKGAGGT